MKRSKEKVFRTKGFFTTSANTCKKSNGKKESILIFLSSFFARLTDLVRDFNS